MPNIYQAKFRPNSNNTHTTLHTKTREMRKVWLFFLCLVLFNQFQCDIVNDSSVSTIAVSIRVYFLCFEFIDKNSFFC